MLLQIIEKFLSGDRNAARLDGGGDTHEIVLNEMPRFTSDGKPSHTELIIFEMNATTGKWRKLRRKLMNRHAAVASGGGAVG